jgi:hypothetical protein
VRSFQTNARIRSLTTGTFNRVVKDRIAIRLSGANSVQANPHKCESDCPRNLTNIRAAQNPVNASVPQHFHLISTIGIRGGGQESGTSSAAGFRFSASAGRARSERATVWPSASQIVDFKAFLGHAKAEDRKLRKELTFGGPCFEGTLQKPTGVSESSPVAGTIEGFNPSQTLDAGRARELQKSAQPATQMLSVNCLYQRKAKRCKGKLKNP